MTRRTFVGIAAVVWTGAAIAVACGDSSSDVPGTLDGGSGEASVTPTPPPTPPGPPPPPANYVVAPAGAGKAYCDSTYGAIVAYLNRCCDANDKATPQYGLAAGLFTVFGGICDRDLEASIAKGRLLYDPALASACDSALAPLATATCGTNLQSAIDPLSGAACATAFAGSVAAGQPCAGPFECSKGLTCVGYANTTKDAGAVEGTCQVPPAIGQPCGQVVTDAGGTLTTNYPFATKQDCAPGAYCPKTAGGNCTAQKDAGAFCFDAKECQTAHCYLDKCDSVGPVDAGTCASGSDCTSGLFCEKPDASAPTGSCATKRPATSTCSGAFTSECKGRCLVPDGGTTGSCVSFCGSG